MALYKRLFGFYLLADGSRIDDGTYSFQSVRQVNVNFKEGTRRLALLLGAVGVILGGVVSYVELQSALEQRVNHNKWVRLSASDVVQQERKTCLDPPPRYDKLNSQLQPNSAGIKSIRANP